MRGFLARKEQRVPVLRSAERHHQRGRMLARERIELLLDLDAPFLELSALAACPVWTGR
jgi:acetyl-CoA carboxylase carboxyltransferase component